MTISSEQAPEAFTSHHGMATTTTTAMTARNVDDQAPWAKAWNFHIASRNGDHDSKNRQRRTTTVGRRGLVLEHTIYIHIALRDVNDDNGN